MKFWFYSPIRSTHKTIEPNTFIKVAKNRNFEERAQRISQNNPTQKHKHVNPFEKDKKNTPLS